MKEVHPNFKKGYENMKKISEKSESKEIYKKAQGKAKHKALLSIAKENRVKGGSKLHKAIKAHEL